MNNFSNIDGRIYIPPHGEMYAKFNITPVGDKDIVGSIQPIIHNNMSSNLKISEYGRMTVTVDVIEEPKITLKLLPDRDAMTREGVPTLNYGLEQTMLVGRSYNLGGERYRSVLHFDVSSIPEDVFIDKATIHLYSNSVIENAPYKVGVYKSSTSNWTEVGVTWRNQPYIGDLISAFDMREMGHIELDITSYINDIYKGLESNNGLIIKALNENIQQYINLYTKESGVVDYKPILQITYYDNILRSIGRASLDSDIFIYSVKENDLRSSIFIPTMNAFNDKLKGSVLVNNPRDIPSKIKISRPSQLGGVAVRRSKECDLTNSISVRTKARNDMEDGKKPSSIQVSRKYMDGKLYVNPYHNFEGSVTVRQNVSVNLEQAGKVSTVAVSKDKIYGNIYVRFFDELDSNITVRGGKVDGGLPDLCSISVSKPTMGSNIYIRYTNDVSSNAIVRQTVSIDDPRTPEFVGQIGISKHTIGGSIFVRAYSDVDSSISVRRTVALDDAREPEFNGALSVSKPTIEGNIFVRIYSDVNTNIKVRKTISSDDPREPEFTGQIGVSKHTIKGKIYVRPFKDISARVTVRQTVLPDDPREPEFTGSLSVSRKTMTGSIVPRLHVSITSAVVVRQMVSSDDPREPEFTGVLGVNKPNMEANVKVVLHNDMSSQIAVRVNVEDNQDGEVSGRLQIKFREDFNSKINVIGANRLPSNVWVLSGYLRSNLAIPTYVKDDKPSTITVRIKFVNDLYSKFVVIRQDEGGYAFIL